MAVSKNAVELILSGVEREGSPKLEMAPLEKVPPGLPPTWGEVLAHKEPTKVVWDLLWKPMLKDLPKTIKTFRKSLQGLGLLTTKKRPPSLAYIYTRAKGSKSYAYRGFVPEPVKHPSAKVLPPELLKFYTVHNGWGFLWGNGLGPLPVSDWYTLSDNPKSPGHRFLAVFHNGGGASLGFDLEESPPLCYVVWSDDKPQVVPDLWREIDRWTAGQLEDLDPA